jgi:lipoyl(octanoyl) transferase
LGVQVQQVTTEMWVAELGLVDYQQALELQERLREQRIDAAIPDTLLLLEHPAVITRGRRGLGESLPGGMPIVDVDRGGRATWHGPGQLVGYPVVAAPDVVGHVRMIEEAIVDALAEVGVRARARVEDGPDYTGVWVGERKIASIGVHVRRGVATHGFAVNVVNDLAPFEAFNPCGLAGVQMTSLAQEAPAACERGTTCIGRRIARLLCEQRGARQRIVAAARIRQLATREALVA